MSPEDFRAAPLAEFSVSGTYPIAVPEVKLTELGYAAMRRFREQYLTRFPKHRLAIEQDDDGDWGAVASQMSRASSARFDIQSALLGVTFADLADRAFARDAIEMFTAVTCDELDLGELRDTTAYIQQWWDIPEDVSSRDIFNRKLLKEWDQNPLSKLGTTSGEYGFFRAVLQHETANGLTVNVQVEIAPVVIDTAVRTALTLQRQTPLESGDLAQQTRSLLDQALAYYEGAYCNFLSLLFEGLDVKWRTRTARSTDE